MRSPQRQRKGGEVDRLPDQLEEQDRNHLHGIPEAEQTNRSETGEQAKLYAALDGNRGSVVEYAGPDVGAKAGGENEITHSQRVEAEQGHGGHDVPRGGPTIVRANDEGRSDERPLCLVGEGVQPSVGM